VNQGNTRVMALGVGRDRIIERIFRDWLPETKVILFLRKMLVSLRFIVTINQVLGDSSLNISYLKWYVPSLCPKPLPGTTQIPVSSNNSMQYKKSGS
jgi:hypothetical protein